MKAAVAAKVADTDVLVMAAAVADYRARATAPEKIKKAGDNLTLELVRTPDILSEVRGDFIRVGFAAETENLLENATQKFRQKELDIIVANDISEGVFGEDTNRVTIIDKDGKPEALPLMSKQAVADRILDKIIPLLPCTG
jgi:phosphopantothenoylcysteine decarboxylase/phosphopantothenate--cysteine ligase